MVIGQYTHNTLKSILHGAKIFGSPKCTVHSCVWRIENTCVQTSHTTHVHIHKLHSYVTNQDKKAVDRARSLNNIKLY